MSLQSKFTTEPAALTRWSPDRPVPASIIRKQPESTAPWANATVDFLDQRYGQLIARAPSAPHEGSYGLAIKALEECLQYPDPDDEDPGIRFAPSRAGQPTPRKDAYDALRRPCKGLGSRKQLEAQLDGLRRNGRAVGDPLLGLEELTRRLNDPAWPKQERQQILETALAMNDAIALRAVYPALVGRGAMFDSQELSMADSAAYIAAWQHIMCMNYRDCLGPGTRQGHKDCLVSGQCDYPGIETQVERMAPGLLGQRVLPYYLRIQAHLDRGRYSAFGAAPSSSE